MTEEDLERVRDRRDVAWVTEHTSTSYISAYITVGVRVCRKTVNGEMELEIAKVGFV